MNTPVAAKPTRREWIGLWALLAMAAAVVSLLRPAKAAA
jgi:hypothetical protein